jgi:hypothetical protein
MSDIKASPVIRAGEAFTVDSVNRLVTEHGELEAIVRDLADRGAPPSYDEETCWYCDAWAARPPEQHEADCTWRKSVMWVSAHPVSGDQQ